MSSGFTERAPLSSAQQDALRHLELWASRESGAAGGGADGSAVADADAPSSSPPPVCTAGELEDFALRAEAELRAQQRAADDTHSCQLARMHACAREMATHADELRASLAGKAGMRTVEASYEYYMRQYRYLGSAPECQWNGPIWPYQTTQVLHGMANLLNDRSAHGPVTRSTYMRLLRQYAALHYQGDRLDLEEDYHPETGKPIVGLARSHHYFHSGFNDLILTGLVGIRPRADDVLEVNPLLPAMRSASSWSGTTGWWRMCAGLPLRWPDRSGRVRGGRWPCRWPMKSRTH